jgi:S-formylglutathione hydrolase FrmB
MAGILHRWGLRMTCVAAILQGSLAQAKAVCQKYFSEMRQTDVKYCIDKTLLADNRETRNIPVVYFMHGAAGGTEQYPWIGYEKAVASLDDAHRAPAVAFVSFETSALSFYTDWADRKDAHRYESWLLNEFIPMIEHTHPQFCHERECRGLLGVSMGGYGVLKTALLHPERFAFAAATNPALLPFNIFRPYWEWDIYWTQTTIGNLFGRYFIWRMRKIFGNAETFQKNDPIEIAKNLDLSGPVPSLYFDIAGKDEFGFEEGHDLFRAVLDARGISYQTRFFPKAHHIIPHQPQSESAIEFIIDELSRRRTEP